eukprot:g8007.t1
MDVLQRRDLAVSDRERYRMAAEDVEPIFQVLHELLETCEASAAQLHSAARAAAADGPADAEIWELFRVADRAEDDVQLKPGETADSFLFRLKKRLIFYVFL